MTITIAVVAPGAMGSAIARRLSEGGARVLTSLEGRGPATRARAAEAGMTGASDAEIAGADILLSIVPPAEAVALAERFAPHLAGPGGRAVYADCNAVDVGTVRRVEAALGLPADRFADGGIIGLPPRPGERGPVLYLSGAAAPALARLGDLGLRVSVMDGPVGAASALKMSYAGITKGFTAVGAAMVLAAERAGALPALAAELAQSQPALFARLSAGLPDMLPKAYRWVAEMEEIATFVGPEHGEAAIYGGAARLYERLAAGDPEEAEVLRRFASSPAVR